MIFIWQEILFRPLLNLLIGLYNTIGLQNLGLAIVWLTIVVRIVLLPTSLKDESRRRKKKEMQAELAALQKSYANVPSVMREEQRALLKKYRFRKWPKILNLSVQGLILLVLYQVFVGGIRLKEIVDALYSWVDVPVTINTMFLGFDISQRSFILSLIAALILFAGIYVDLRSIKRKLTYDDMLYAFGLPAATFVFLWILPAVKAVFIITTLLFSDILIFMSSFRKSVKEQEKMIKAKTEEKKAQKAASLPHPKSRFK